MLLMRYKSFISTSSATKFKVETFTEEILNLFKKSFLMSRKSSSVKWLGIYDCNCGSEQVLDIADILDKTTPTYWSILQPT